MEDIAAAAAVSRATLFRRFPSRNALVAELSRRAVHDYVAATDSGRPEDGPPDEALRRVVGRLADLAPHYGLLVLQPLGEVVERQLLDDARVADDRLYHLVLRGQEEGVFRVDLSAEWVLTTITWLIVGAADGLRLGRLAPADVQRVVIGTVLGALRR